jgi:transglutaminase-like putative cysteine protease
MNLRLTVTAAVAVILASVSVYPLIQQAGWFWAGVGAVIAAAVAGIITRLPTLRAAVAGSVLALVAVYPLLASPYWGLKVAGAAVVAITAASRPRLRVLQALACVIIYLAALLIYLNALFASRLSVAGLVPTRASLSYLSSLVNQGLAERIYQPAVPSYPGVVLLAAAGIGLMAAATDLLAVRLRSPAIAGLPLLALYCVRITTAARQGGVGATIVFCLTMIGYLALLAADGRERLRIWGRLVTVWQGPAEMTEAEAPDTRALAASGRRIGLAAACIALAFPLLVPGISVHDLFQTQPTADGPGGPLIAPPNPLVQMQSQLLRSSPQTVLTYTTTARDWQEQYLQVYVLNYDYSGQAWKLVPLEAASPVNSGGTLRAAQGVTASTPQATTTTTITLSQKTTGYEAKLNFLALPYAPEMLQQIPGGWAEDDATLMVYSTQPQMSGLRYTVTSREVNPDSADENDAAAYPANIKNGYLAFPAGPHDELAKLARRITAHAHTKYEKALALESYFLSGTFAYSTTVTIPAGIPGLIDFLYFAKSGYCQQFAFAMAGLARLIGIPSRIAVGYTAGTTAGRGTPRGTRKVTTADAHAWPELYFSGLGWIRFEPTPGGAAGQGTATVPQYATEPGASTGPKTSPAGQNLGSKAGPGIGRQNAAHLHGLGDTGTGGTASLTASDRGIALWALLILAIVIAAAAIAPPVARSLVRRRRLQTAGDARLAHAVWREVRDDLADYGFACRPSESPRAVAARVAGAVPLDPSAREALARIVSAEERARYATAPLPSPTLRADCATFRRALAHQAGRAERWRARLLPASMLTPIRPALQHALDVFGWMDAAGLRLRGREPRGGELSGAGLGDGVRPQE